MDEQGRWSGNAARGAAAGAAGLCVLDAVTHLDMAVRARPASRTPVRTVERLAERAGLRVPGTGEQRERRLAGLAGLAGVINAVGVGAIVGSSTSGASTSARALLLTAAMMAGTNAPMIAAGITDPRSWSTSEWASDLVPHLAYGAITAALLSCFDHHG